MKKIFLCAVIAILVMGSWAGLAAAKEKIVWVTHAVIYETTGNGKLFQQFTKDTGIEIEVQTYPTDQLFTKVFADLSAGGASYDVVNFNDSMFNLDTYRFFEPLKPYMDKDPLPDGGLSDFVPGMVRQYYEINVSPRNTVFDAYILNGRPWNGPRTNFRGLKDYTCDGLVTKVHVEGPLDAPGAKGWSAEYAIPFASLVGPEHLAPRPGDRWRMNLFRIDSPEKGKLELYSWSPTEANDFHRPWRFGTLVFR